MGSLRRYIVTYDIADPARLRHVEKIMTNHGSRVQLSVFFCDLSPQSLNRMKRLLLQNILDTEDSVMIVNIGGEDASQSSPFTYLGQARPKQPISYRIV